jgi:hypothetical protein
MGSLHIPPPAAGNARSDDSASSSSNSRYTPVSNDPEEQEQEEYDYSASRLGKAPMGNLRLQTDFEEDAETGEPVSEDEDNRYDSDEDIEGKTGRAVDGPKYTPDEEKEVVSVFDRRLVPFLALLYLLAFLDRSSMFALDLWCLMIYIVLTGGKRYRKRKNRRSTR